VRPNSAVRRDSTQLITDETVTPPNDFSSGVRMKERHVPVAKKQAMYVRIVARTAAVAGQRKDHVTAPGANECCTEDEHDEEVDEEDEESAAQAQVEDREAFKTLCRP
jgi:hypothetical protein